jgi:O-antigen ligase
MNKLPDRNFPETNTMTSSPGLHAAPPSSLIIWTQNAAIFACCAVLVSTALASIGFVVFLLLFACVCATSRRRELDVHNFPKGLAAALAVYFAWQMIGLTYTAAPLSYAMETIYSDRKILFILPLVLLFSGAEPKRRFLVVFFGLATAGMLLSFALATPFVQQLIAHSSLKLTRSSMPLAPENLFRSYATQSMVFALCAFLSQWFASQQKIPARKWLFQVLSLGFLINLATVTDGRSGYVVFLVLVVWCFVLWRGLKGMVLGTFAALLVGAVAFTFSSSVHDRVMKGVTEIQSFATIPTETSLGRRMVMYQTTLGIIRENPLFGLGTGGFKQEFSAIAAEKYSGWRATSADDPHNQYLFILAENGFVGLAAFLFMLATMIHCCLKSGSIYGKMAAGCLLAWCATSLFSGHFRTFPEGHLIAFIVGILMVSRAPDGRQASDTPSSGTAA